MKGRWAAGIEPRNFAWILKDQLAVSERPGGFAPHHRRVRRQEEILWLTAHGFTHIVSLLPSNHNLHAYGELHLPAAHYALPTHGDVRPVLGDLYGALWDWLHGGERVLLHQDELGEQLAGVVAGFLCWSGLLPEPPRAVSAVEQLLRRQMGHAGRSLVAAAAEMPPGPAAHRPPAPIPARVPPSPEPVPVAPTTAVPAKAARPKAPPAPPAEATHAPAKAAPAKAPAPAKTPTKAAPAKAPAPAKASAPVPTTVAPAKAPVPTEAAPTKAAPAPAAPAGAPRRAPAKAKAKAAAGGNGTAKAKAPTTAKVTAAGGKERASAKPAKPAARTVPAAGDPGKRA